MCSGCRVSEQKPVVDWDHRWALLKKLTDEYRSDDNYDVVIPVSGGKDSYFQTHIMVKELLPIQMGINMWVNIKMV